MQLTNKERMFLQDGKKHEELCIQKYAAYASQAQDPQLKQLFNKLGSQEQQHYQSINQMLSGQMPASSGQNQSQGSQSQSQGSQSQSQGQGMQSQSQGTQNQGQGMQSQSQGMQGGSMNFAPAGSAAKIGQNDAMLCEDALTTEKYVSGVYDTAIFECSDTNIRQTLNHIQKEEQQHGETLFNFMQSKGWYNAQ